MSSFDSSPYRYTFTVDPRHLDGPSWYTADPLFFRNPYGPSTTPKPAPPPTPAQRLADEAARLAKEGTDVSAVTRAIADVEKERHSTVEKALQGALDMAKLGTAKAKRFRLAFYDLAKKGVVVAEGVEFANENDDKTRDYVFVPVKPSTSSLPYNGFISMKRLREILDERKIVYSIAYID